MPVLMRENTMIGNLAIKPGERESVSVTGDGEKTVQDLLYELAQKIDISKVNDSSYVVMKTAAEIQEIPFIEDLIYNITDIITASYNGQDMLEIKLARRALGDSVSSPSVYMYELKLNNADKDNNYHLKNTMFCVSGSQTPTMTLSYMNTDTMSSGSEIIFYY